MSYYHEAAFLAGSSYSSFSSDSSSCGNSSPHPSSLGLRRSTMDLSDLNSSGISSQNSLSSQRSNSSSQIPSTEEAVKGHYSSASKFPSSRDCEVKRNHRGIDAIVQDTFLDTLPVIDITNAFSKLLSHFFDKKRDGDDYRNDPAIKFRPKHRQRCKKAEETKEDEYLSPCQIQLSKTDTDEDWDHFADFQDRVDERLTFTPFPAHQSKGKMDTLDEILEEEDECLDVFSF